MSSSLRARVVRNPPRSRDTLTDIIGRIEVDIVAESYLYIGSGFKSMPANLVEELKKAIKSDKSVENLRSAISTISTRVFKEYEAPVVVKGRLVIPGSSVKGNVRSRLELSFVPKGDQIRACLIRAGDYPIEPPSRGMLGWRHFRIWEKSLKFIREGPCDYTRMQNVCLLCDLFGTAGLAGLIHFSDFEGPSISSAMPLSLPVGESLLVAKPGSVFSGHVMFMNVKPWELGLLFYGMGLRNKAIGRPVLLGKHKYRRYGDVKLGIVRYRVKRLQLSKLSSPLKVAVEVKPEGSVEGENLERAVNAALELVRENLENELVDIDEVKALEQIEV